VPENQRGPIVAVRVPCPYSVTWPWAALEALQETQWRVWVSAGRTENPARPRRGGHRELPVQGVFVPQSRWLWRQSRLALIGRKRDT